jgi:hypothetical protein
MTARRCAVFALLLLCAVAQSLTAQSIKSPYQFIEPSQSGGVWFGQVKSGTSTVGLQPNDGTMAGLRYTIRFSGPFTGEVEAGYLMSTRTVVDTVVVDSAFQSAGEADAGVLLVTGALRFNLTGARTWHRLQPFLVFGGGVAVDVLGESGDDDKVAADARFDFGTSFAGHLGGGIEWFATDRLTLRLDARNALWKVTTPAAFSRSGLAARIPADEWVQNGLFSLGIAFHF